MSIFIENNISIDHSKVTLLSRYRNNLISTNTNHFSSYGKVFGIGIRASYSIDDIGRSFGKYRYKKDSIKTGKF